MLYLDTKIIHTIMPGKALIISHFIGQIVLNLNPRIETKSYDINDFKEANDVT